jgi:beta-barrel assembly-enhancing protease
MISTNVKSTAVLLGLMVALAAPVSAQRTALRTGPNSFTMQQDIEMGRALSRSVESASVLSDDVTARDYVRRLGAELAARAPGYRYPYEFRVFSDQDVRTMALPGGIIYVSSGLVASMQGEPQLAAVLAHQIGHVAARHGSEKVSQEYSRIGRQARFSVNDAISRLNLTGDSDSIVVRYDSQAEQQADTIATQILYDTRFDPRQIPTAFQHVIDQDRTGSRDFAFNHPTPPNRTAVIRRELQRLGPLPGSWRGDSAAFRTAQQSLRNESSFGLARVDDNDVTRSANVPRPSTRWTTYREVDFELQHPDNWRVDATGTSTVISPDGGSVGGEVAHGMMINTFQPQNRGGGFFGRNDFSVPGQSAGGTSVSSATDQLIEELRRSNPNIRVIRKSSKRIDGFDAMMVELNNDSPLGGTEVDHLTAVLHSNGQLYYFLGVTPQSENSIYTPVFDRIINSIRFY